MQVEDLRGQLAARRKLGLGIDSKGKGVEEQPTNTAVGPSRAYGGYRFGKSRIEADFQKDLTVGATGVVAEPDHHDGEKLNADVSKDGIIGAHSAEHYNKEDDREDGGLAVS